MLDYFEGVHRLLDGGGDGGPDGHTIFRFEGSMSVSEGDVSLLEQVCYQLGYPAPVDDKDREKRGQPWRYLTGEARELLDDMPELAALRDVVFLAKAFMVETVAELPPTQPWLGQLL